MKRDVIGDVLDAVLALVYVVGAATVGYLLFNAVNQ
jgi:hypothetical protein